MFFLTNSNHRGSSKNLTQKRGFTMAELMISVTILGILLTTASMVYVNFYASVRNIKAANSVYDESRFLMERITKEIRNGTVDYEEYYNQNLRKDMLGDSYELVRNETYAQDYCQYSLKFYNPGKDGEIGTADDESTGKLGEYNQITEDIDNNILPAIGRFDIATGKYVPDPIQNNLYLINISGNQRTYLKRIVKEVNGQKIGKIGILRLIGNDFGIDHIDPFAASSENCIPDSGENDGRIDTWLCDEGFNCKDFDPITISDPDTGYACTGIPGQIIVSDPNTPDQNSFVDITPSSLDIVDIKFMVAPMDDPRKAYNEDAIQIQPHITIKLIARANPSLAASFQSDKVPDIVLESTISARAYNEIITECNLKQCSEFSAPRACPLTEGVCGPSDPTGDPLTQKCSTNFLWPGCAEQDYEDYSILTYGLTSDGKDFYEPGSEFSSCDSALSACLDAAADDAEKKTCNDTANGCKDKLCTDGYDNDCDGLTDQNDPDCKYHLCNNGTRDPDPAATFPPDPLDPTQWLESCIDVGGICAQIRPYEQTEEITCDDGYDNDCDNYADEFDPDCIKTFCTNGEFNPSDGVAIFLDLDYSPKNYLVNANPLVTSMSETCIDIGGICDLCLTSDGKTSCVCGSTDCTAAPAGKIVTTSNSGAEIGDLCFDGMDNDCDNYADELDNLTNVPSHITMENTCVPAICGNTIRDCELVQYDYEPTDYLVNFLDTDTPKCREFPTLNDLEEQCINVGGICDGYREVIDIGGGINKYKDHTEIGNEAVPAVRAPSTPPENTCTDGLDNDCNGLIDDKDPACCFDSDGDLIPGKSETCQHTSDGGTVLESVPLDCKDDDILTYPGAPEICDGVADNDCDGWLDNNYPNETDCCTDEDGDGYGTAGKYLSCALPFEPDCNDNNVDIFPSPTESLCLNEIDDNCNGKTDHIDSYREQPGGIQKAFEDKVFDPSCCIFTMEKCDDNTYPVTPAFPNSDENCNGKEGEDDYYCVDIDWKKFFDNFTSQTYLNLAESDPEIKHDATNGNISLNSSADVNVIVKSKLTPLTVSECATGYQVFISPVPSVSIPTGASIQFQFSDDNGATWCGDDSIAGACDGTDWITMDEIATVSSVTFNSPTYQLLWRAELSGGDDDVPVLNDISIVFSCL